MASPYIEIDVVGVDNDSAMKKRTQVVRDNGLTPVWNETFQFEVSMPELACLCITVFDEDIFGDSNAIGQSVLPLGTKDSLTLRNGWRSIPLYTIFGDPLGRLSLEC